MVRMLKMVISKKVSYCWMKCSRLWLNMVMMIDVVVSIGY